MSIRLAAASGLALAAALTVATAARAQGFFEFYDISPRQIAGMLADEGYELNGPMLRRGDVYICNALSISGRPMRLIVDAHRGRVLERFAVSDGRRYGDESYDRRSSRYDEENGSDDERPRRRHDQVALGDPGDPPSQSDDADESSWKKLTPTEVLPDPTPKPKRHANKKHRETAVANAPASTATPSPESTTTVELSKPNTTAEPSRPAPSPSLAAVAPSAPAETPKPPVRIVKLPPAPEAAKPNVEAAKSPVEAAKSPVEAAKSPVEAAKPAQTPEPPKAAPAHATVEAEKAPLAEKPKAESAHKKINDLPVGTLD